MINPEKREAYRAMKKRVYEILNHDDDPERAGELAARRDAEAAADPSKINEVARVWICRGCGNMVIASAGVRPIPLTWADGHVCRLRPLREGD